MGTWRICPQASWSGYSIRSVSCCSSAQEGCFVIIQLTRSWTPKPMYDYFTVNECSHKPEGSRRTTGTLPPLADVGRQQVLVQKLLSKHGVTSEETLVSLRASHTKGIRALRESLPPPPAKPSSAQRLVSQGYPAACQPPLRHTLFFLKWRQFCPLLAWEALFCLFKETLSSEELIYYVFNASISLLSSFQGGKWGHFLLPLCGNLTSSNRNLEISSREKALICKKPAVVFWTITSPIGLSQVS